MTPVSDRSRKAIAIATIPDTTTDPIEWARLAAQVADQKGGLESIILDVGDVLAITGAFVITSAGNRRLVKALVNEIEGQISQAGGPRPKRVEGLEKLEWVLMDYGDFVVHVFLEASRKFYELERLWADVPRVEWQYADRDAGKEGTAADG